MSVSDISPNCRWSCLRSSSFSPCSFFSTSRLRFLNRCALLTTVLSFLTATAFASSNKMPAKYAEWLKKDVVYIITNQERETFKGLNTDEAREKFIEHFWELRNPNPGAPTNPYKDEHYQRLEYASDHFSPAGRRDGWATDMGRVYITLGAPEQKARYVTQSGVRGMEIWFYQSVHPSLPPFFSVVFYEKSFGDFRLYSPYMDGPQKLVTGIQAEQGRVQSVQQIDRILGREVARTTLTLLPDEPVNMNDANSTLLSDLMLGTIRDLANNPFTVEKLKLRQALSEEVSHRVVLPADLLNVLCLPLRDGQGKIRLHYALRLPEAQDFAVAQADQRFYYSIDTSVKILGADGKEILTRQRKLAKYLSKEELEPQKGKPVLYEGWVALAPGKYTIKFLFTNLLTRTTFPGERVITIPELGSRDMAVTDPVPFSQAGAISPEQAEFMPFTGGGIRFRPYVSKELALVPGQDLKFFYQIWESPAGVKGDERSTLAIDYSYGRPSISGTAKTIHEELSAAQFDPSGSMINGKKIETMDLGTGNYRLSITVSDPHAQIKRFSSIPFQIVSDNNSPSESWIIDDDGLFEYLNSGQSDFDRGLIYLAKKDSKAAEAAFGDALQRDPNFERARAKLAEQYFQRQDFAKVIELYAKTPVTEKTDEGTILAVADSLDRTGRSSQAVDLVESALKVRPPSGPLYLALGTYYQHVGNNDRAQSFQSKGRAMMSETGEKNAEQN